MDISKLKIENTTYDIKDSVARSSISDLQNSISTTVDNTGGHDYVEIGGIKWATMNIGANSITDYGLYFAWGDTQGYTAEQVGSGEGQKYFGWADYKYGKGTSYPGGDTGITKYNATDGKTVLEASDDAAVANWGGFWRMPTTAEFQALGEAVTYAWTQVNNVYGILCTDKTDSSKTLFFPAAGYCRNGSVRNVGNNGNYWSSSLDANERQTAYHLAFNSLDASWDNADFRYFGYAVRGVFDGPTTVTIPNYVEKSSTEGLLKNDGTVDTNAYLTQHQDISGKANVSHTHTTADVTDLIEHIDHTNNVEYVDLGLPSGKMWAKYNIGASSETDYGTAFQWGATSAYSGTDNYYTTAMSGGEILPLTNDTARQILGGDWRMPTKAEWKELFDNTIKSTFQQYNSDHTAYIYGIVFYKPDYSVSLKIPCHMYNSPTGQFDNTYNFQLYPSAEAGNSNGPYSVRLMNGSAQLWGDSNQQRSDLYNVRAIIDTGVVDRDKYIPYSEKGTNNGIVPLESDGKIADQFISQKYYNIGTGYYYNGNFYSVTPYHEMSQPTPDSTKIITPSADKLYLDWHSRNLYYYLGGNWYLFSATGGSIGTATDSTWIQQPNGYYAYIVNVTQNLDVSGIPNYYEFTNGSSIRILFTATSQQTITIKHNATYSICPDAADLTITIPAGGFREVTFMRANDKVYVIPNKF